MHHGGSFPWRGRLLAALPALILLATPLAPSRVMAQCTVTCTCSDGHYSGSETGGPFYSTSQCESYIQDATSRCSAGGPYLSTDCTSCDGCEPQQAPQQQQQYTAPQPAQPSQQDIDRANAQNIWNKNHGVPDQQAAQAVQKQISDQMQAMQKIQEQRQAAGTALSQLGCSEFLSRSAADSFQHGQFDDAANYAHQASSWAMDGKPPAVSCGDSPLARYAPPPVPAPTMVPFNQTRINLIKDISQNTSKVKDLTVKQDQAKKLMDEAQQAKQFWQQKVDSLKASSPPQQAAPAGPDPLQAAMEALQQSDDAYQEAQKSYDAAGNDINAAKASLQKDFSSLNAAGQGGKP